MSERTLTCPHCGATNRRADTTCSACGQPLVLDISFDDEDDGAGEDVLDVTLSDGPEEAAQPTPEAYAKFPLLPVPTADQRAALAGGVPDEVVAMGWCWGAFTFTWMWGAANKVPSAYLALLGAVIPFAGPAFAIWLAIKGHELAWQGGRFATIEQFRETMRAWNTWGLWVFVVTVVAGTALGVWFGMELWQFLRS